MEIHWTTEAVEAEWVPSAAMAKVLGIHPQTLRKLRCDQITPFNEGRDYRWVGLITSSTLQWHVHSASQAFTDFRRMPAEQIETYRHAQGVRAGS